MHKNTSTSLSVNRKALAEYEILEKFEAGIVLSGAEVKSLRGGHANLKGSFVEISDHEEAFTRNIHISPYKQAPKPGYDPTQKRKLLLHHDQIIKLKNALDTKGITIVPLDFHLSHNRIKLTVAPCRGKKKYDRREDLKKKAQNLEISRALKRY